MTNNNDANHEQASLIQAGSNGEPNPDFHVADDSDTDTDTDAPSGIDPDAVEDAADEIITTTGINSVVYDDEELAGHVLLCDYDDQDPLEAEDCVAVTAALAEAGGSDDAKRAAATLRRELTTVPDSVTENIDQTTVDTISASGTTHVQMLKELAELPGLTAVFESSPGSYHAWNLTVRSREETAIEKMELHDDPIHLKLGYRKYRWTLRSGAKQYTAGDRSGEEYKSPPELNQVWWNETDQPQSRPHFDVLRLIAQEQDHPDPADELPDDPDAVNWHGDGMEREQYWTVTDTGKKDIRDAKAGGEGE